MALSDLIAVAGFGCTNYLSVYLRGMAVWALWKILAISASAEDAII